MPKLPSASARWPPISRSVTSRWTSPPGVDAGRSVAPVASGRSLQIARVRILPRLGLAAGVDRHPPAVAHAGVVHLALRRARLAVALELGDGVTLVELHPLPLVRDAPAEGGQGQQQRRKCP